jgi:hypothetical protein
MHTKILLSIIIVNWNTRNLLVDCLQSICDTTPAEELSLYEIFVVDNASSDDSVDCVRRRFPWVKLIVNPVNVGFGRANNQAIDQSSGEFVLLLNSDTKLLPGAFSELTDFMQRTPQAGAAGSRLLNPDGSTQPSCTYVPSLGREMWRLFHLDTLVRYASYDMLRWPLDRSQPVEVVQGASMIVRRTVIESVGVFDCDYFMYSEEVDWCDRILRAGWQIYWTPTSRVIHYGGQSTRQAARGMFLHLYRSKLLFFRKQRSVLEAKLYKLLLAGAALVRLLASPFVLFENASRRRHHLLIAGHYWHLLVELPRM